MNLLPSSRQRFSLIIYERVTQARYEMKLKLPRHSILEKQKSRLVVWSITGAKSNGWGGGGGAELNQMPLYYPT
jgi:hypothetical protein